MRLGTRVRAHDPAFSAEWVAKRVELRQSCGLVVPSGPVQSGNAQPAVILVGAAPATQTALVDALSRRGLYVETVPVQRAQKAAILTAPDIAVLVDEAVADGGIAVLDQFESSLLSSVVPTIVVCEDPTADARIEAFRRGATAVVHRPTRAQDLAGELSATVREILARKSQTYGELGEVTLREFLKALSPRLRPEGPGEGVGTAGASLPVSFTGGRPLAQLVDGYVQQVRQHVPAAKPLGYEAGDSDAFSRGWLEASRVPPESSLTGLRVALADDDETRGATIARELQSRGATVLLTDLNPSGHLFAHLRQLDPSVLVIGAEQLDAAGYELVWRLQGDARLRWTTLLIAAEWGRLGPGPDQGALIEQLALRLTALIQPEQELRNRLFEGSGFDVRLESMGPARLLYALVDPPVPIRLEVHSQQLRVRIDVSDRLLVGVTVEGELARRLEGVPALEAFLTLSVARARVEPVAHAVAANVMTSVQDALTLADRDENARPAQQPPTKALVVGDATLVTGGAVLNESQKLAVGHPSSSGAGRDEPAAGAADPPEARSAANDAVPHRRVQTTDTSRRRARLVAVSVAAFLCGAALLVVWGAGRDDASSGATQSGAGVRPVRGDAHARASTSGAGTRAPSAASVADVVGPGASLPSEQPAHRDQQYRTARPNQAGPLPVAHAGNPPAPSCADLVNDTIDAADEPSEPLQLIQVARRLLVLGDADEAQRAYCRVLVLEPGNPTAQGELARLLMVRRDGVAGLREVDRALVLDPTSRVLHGVRGDALARLGRYEEARPEWIVEARLRPGTPNDEKALLGTVLRGARAYLQRHAWGEAERYCRRAIVLDHASLDASMCLARALSALGDAGEARLWARYAQKLAPSSARAAAMLRSLGEAP